MATQVHNLPKFPVSPVAVTRLLSRHTRAELAGFVSVAIDLLDVLDGDPDNEEDDPPGQCNEDEVNTNLHAQWGEGPGCEISDGPEEDDHAGECSEDEISCGPGHWGGLHWRDHGPGCLVSDAGVTDYGAMSEAYGSLGGVEYGDDQTKPLGAGHEP